MGLPLFNETVVPETLKLLSDCPTTNKVRNVKQNVVMSLNMVEI